MAEEKNRITLTVVILLAFAALVTGLYVSQHVTLKKKVNFSSFQGTLLKTPREIEQFSLTGMDNQPFTNQSLQGQWTMIFFGFTNCSYLCPTTLVELSKMHHLLQEKNINPLPKIVLISIDSERDTAERLRQYITAFHPQFYAATGEVEHLQKMTREMGIVYEKVSTQETGGYDVLHSGSIMLFNPQGQLNAFFTTPHQAQHLAQDYKLLVS
ncbi:MAG: SCO family protein [Silvanigrellaceae bacterium]|nr:SCO family protein [Silvanigrellaceae bacterium]